MNRRRPLKRLLVGFVALGLLTSPALAQQQRPAKPPAKAPTPPPAPSDKDKSKDKKPAAEAQFSVDVMVLHATNKKKGIDPRIGKMPELGKPPFSSYDSYELLSKSRVALDKNDKNTRLPNGRVLRTKLVEIAPDKEHIKLSASINQTSGRTFLPLLEVKAKVGQSFIVAGQSYKGGILVLHIRVVKE
jgi:hypothetical protein